MFFITSFVSFQIFESSDSEIESNNNENDNESSGSKNNVPPNEIIPEDSAQMDLTNEIPVVRRLKRKAKRNDSESAKTNAKPARKRPKRRDESKSRKAKVIYIN